MGPGKRYSIHFSPDSVSSWTMHEAIRPGLFFPACVDLEWGEFVSKARRSLEIYLTVPYRTVPVRIGVSQEKEGGRQTTTIGWVVPVYTCTPHSTQSILQY